MGADDLGTFGLVGEEMIHLLGGPVVSDTVKPWSFMFMIRFWPITARPMSAISP